MAKPPREVDKPGEMCSYNPKTGERGDRWLWDEILGDEPPKPPLSPSWARPVVVTVLLSPNHSPA